MAEELGILDFPSLGYLTIFDASKMIEKLCQFPAVTPSSVFEKQWDCNGVKTYYRKVDEATELRLESSCVKKTNALLQELRGIMLKTSNTFYPFKEAIITLYPGKNDSEDKIDYMGEFGNILQGEEAKPNPNLATENIIFEIAKRNQVMIPMGDMTTRQVSDIQSRFNTPYDQKGFKYLVMGPILIQGYVNRVLDAARELRNEDKKRIFENISVYDSDGNLIKGVDRGTYTKKSDEQKGKPMNIYVS